MHDEIGSFIEFDFKKKSELYNENQFGINNIGRVNSCRAAIKHAIKLYGVDSVYLPRYECDTVIKEILRDNDYKISYYSLNNDLSPILQKQDENSAIVIVNYFGIFSNECLKKISTQYRNVIIDNAQAFYSPPVENCYNCYSPRKFLGVPDGGYIIGPNAKKGIDYYEQDFSSDTAIFLLQRIEYGCSGIAYHNKKLNDDRIDKAGQKQMSVLTQTILSSLPYHDYISIRRNNFKYAQELFNPINELMISKFLDDSCVPYVYPLLLKKDGIIEAFHDNNIFQGHWWEYLVELTSKDTIENDLSRYIIPITIDQRYDYNDIKKQYDIVARFL
ncbi:MAG: hypothetical protein J6H31_14540 [Butyrivibrio sp.]|nr:hypothetical protein [Butyrivibrio sp.]